MKQLHNFLYNGGYPIIITFAYVLIGIFFGVWHPTWLMFLTIPCYYMFVEFRHTNDWNVFPYPILCVILYLAVGFDYGLWHPLWVIFLTIPLYYIFVNARNN